MANNHSTSRCDQMEKEVHPCKKVKYEFSGDSTTHRKQSRASNEVGRCTSTAKQDFSKKRIQYREMENYNYCNTHFAILPNELLVQILRYISISDLWNFCEAFKDTEYLLKDQALTRNINLNGWYDANTKSIFLNINPENVTTLDLNYCHWLPREDLQSFVGKCANLKTLLALGTKLGLTDEDIQSYNKTKINKLAVSIKNPYQTIARKAVLGSVTHLALAVDCYHMFDVCPPKQFARIFPSLQKVWVEGITICADWVYKWLQRYKSVGQIKEQIYHPSRMNLIGYYKFRMSELTGSKFYLSYMGMKDYKRSVACFENINNPTVPHIQLDTAPYGRKVAKLFHSGEKTLETIPLNELNFFQSTYYHDMKCKNCKKAFKPLLMSRNARNCEKLTLCSCLFDDIVIDSSILKEFNNLSFLQLFYCEPDSYWSDLEGYNSIGKLSKLRYLFVEIPQNCDGKFLFDVLKNCPQLETLRTRALDYNLYNCTKSNIAVTNHLFKGLEYSTNLKELMLERFEFLSIDDLLSQLIQLNKIKLQKLSLYCQYVGRFEGILAYWHIGIFALQR